MTRRGWFLISGAILVIVIAGLVRLETGLWFALPDSNDASLDCSFMRSLLWVDPKERAEADATAAIARGERHLLAVYGVALMVPREANQETPGTFTLTAPDNR